MTTAKYVGRHEIKANKCSPYGVSFIIVAGIMIFSLLGSICFAEELPTQLDKADSETAIIEPVEPSATEVPEPPRPKQKSEKLNQEPTEQTEVKTEVKTQTKTKIESRELKANENSRYEGLVLTAKERDMLAGIVWLEARGEVEAGQQAVAEVILNRIVSEDHFSDNLTDVLWQKNQFPTVYYLTSAEPEQLQYDLIEKAMNGPYVLPISVYFFAKEAENENVWGQIGEHIFCYAWDWTKYLYK